MGIDAGIYDRLNTNFGQQLGAIFDPNTNMERQNRLAALANQGELQQMQLMQARNEMTRAPIVQQRQDAEYAQKVAEHQANLNDSTQIRQVLQTTGGDPSKAIQSLLQNGSQPALELASKLHALMPKNDPYTLSQGDVRMGANNQPVAQGNPKDNTKDFNQPFLPGGAPNIPFQNYQRSLKPENANNPKLAYNADARGFIEQPSQQYPNGRIIPLQGGTNTQMASDKTGTDFLGTLEKPQADQIKALAEGRMAFPAGFALKSPYWQDMISKVSQYDPSFDAVNYNARTQTLNDFTKGPSANNVTALNTAIQHLGNLSDAYGKLGNSDYPTYNTVSNYIGNQLGNKEVQKNYAAVSTDSTAVAHELAKVFRQSGMSEAEIKDWESKISTSAAPAQSKQVIKSAIDLMEGRLQALGARYNQGMGTTKQPYELLTPEAKKTWDKLSGGNAQQPGANPHSGKTDAQIKAELGL